MFFYKYPQKQTMKHSLEINKKRNNKRFANQKPQYTKFISNLNINYFHELFIYKKIFTRYLPSISRDLQLSFKKFIQIIGKNTFISLKIDAKKNYDVFVLMFNFKLVLVMMA